MKSLRLLAALAVLGHIGCQGTPQLPEQYEPAFAADEQPSSQDQSAELPSNQSEPEFE